MTKEKSEEKIKTEEAKAEEPKTEEKKEEAPKEESHQEKENKTTKPRINLSHAVLLLHSAGKDITDKSLKKVIEAAGEKADDAQIKSLVANLEGVDIEDAISQAIVAPTAAPAQSSGESKKEEKKEEQPEKKAEEAASGLSSLFG